MSKQEYAASFADRIYGEIKLNREELRLMQTREMAHLASISLTAVPDRTQFAGRGATRREHSLGVLHLAKIVGQKPEFHEIKRDLVAASLFHDAASTPFSHTGEKALEHVRGITHEQFAAEVLDGSDFAKTARSQGVNLDRIIKFINGEDKPWSDLLSGSLDIDNLDNTLRFAISTAVNRNTYRPDELARGLRLQNGRVVLKLADLKDLVGWERCREKTYEYIYGESHNSPGMMVERAIYFAVNEGDIGDNFFRMTDDQAYDFMLNSCNPSTRTLMDEAMLLRHYPRVYDFTTTAPTDHQRELMADLWGRGVIADELSRSLGVDPVNVCVYVGKNKGFKQIHLPIFIQNRPYPHQPRREQTWMAQVFVANGISDRRAEIAEFMSDKLKLNKPSER